MNQYADRYGFKRIDPDEHAALRNYDARRLMEHLGVRMWKVPQMAMDVRRQMAQEIDKIPLFVGVSEMLQALSAAGIILAVVSSNSEANVRQVLGAQNAVLFRIFDCGASVFGKSPKLKAVAKKCGVSPDASILIGDEIRDADAAHKVGMAFGAVAWGYTNPEALLALQPQEFYYFVNEIADQLAK